MSLKHDQAVESEVMLLRVIRVAELLVKWQEKSGDNKSVMAMALEPIKDDVCLKTLCDEKPQN